MRLNGLGAWATVFATKSIAAFLLAVGSVAGVVVSAGLVMLLPGAGNVVVA